MGRKMTSEPSTDHRFAAIERTLNGPFWRQPVSRFPRISLRLSETADVYVSSELAPRPASDAGGGAETDNEAPAMRRQRRRRAVEVNSTYEEIVAKAREGILLEDSVRSRWPHRSLLSKTRSLGTSRSGTWPRSIYGDGRTSYDTGAASQIGSPSV